MAALDDYINAGFSLGQGQALVGLATGGGASPAIASANISSLVGVGFSVTQAQAIEAFFEGGTDSDAFTEQGLWSGTQAAALISNL